MIDTLFEQLLIEDRGTSFETWRNVLPPNMKEYMYFKLCYVITSELPEGLNYEEKKRIKSRMISYLPIWTAVIYVNQEFKVVENEEIKKLLSSFWPL